MRKLTILLAMLGALAATPSTAATFSPTSGAAAFAQAEKPRMSERVKVWTRARIAAAKKRWSANKEKFSACNAELDRTQAQRKEQKQRRLSFHRQADFLQTCMNRKP